jgi:uncharacterized protein (DUF362 family)
MSLPIERSTDIRDAREVAIAHGKAQYAALPPFDPAERYPESAFPTSIPCATANSGYALVRSALQLAGLDADRFGTSDWNPLSSLIEPGNTVVLKPNLVRDFRETQGGDGDCLIAHGSVIRAVLDYAYLALQGRGRIVIADASHNDADFDEIRRIIGSDAIQARYRDALGFEVEVLDLRPERAHKVDGVIVGHSKLPGDPAGYVRVDLGKHSGFAEIEHLSHLLYGSEYDQGELQAHQSDGVHEYLVSKTILDADCVIGIPKLKTHKKVGLTVNLKNLVGINGNKNWLPHHREGSPTHGGDQFPSDRRAHRLERILMENFRRFFPLLGPLRKPLAGPIKALGKKALGDTNVDTIRSGNWYGNDTTWRMTLDLNRILYYADSDGKLHDTPVRRFFSVVDGVVAGEGNGPLDPSPKPLGVVIAGANPLAVDLVAARVMGFDPDRLPILSRAFDPHPYPLARFRVCDVCANSDDPRYAGRADDLRGSDTAFTPHFGWRGHIERQEPTDADAHEPC